MAELPRLNGDEQLFLQTIFTVFHKDGKWPTYNYVERTITRTHPDYDMDAIIKGLPDGFATAFKYSRRYDDEAKLIVPALYYCPEAEEELADFMRVVRFCVDRYYTFNAETPEKDTLEIFSHDLSNKLHMQPLALRKMGLLLQSEYDINFGFSSDLEFNEWHFPLKRGSLGVSRFRGVETFEQYLEKRTPLAPMQPARSYTGQTVLQMAKRRPANDIPVVSMGDTQYHFVQGDQYNISGNAGEVKIKSPSTEPATTEGVKKSPWVSGSFYLVVFMVVIGVLAVIAHLLPIYALPIVVVGGILVLSVIGAFQLRQDERLSEENFLKLMGLSFTYLPLLRKREIRSDKNSKQP